MIFCADALEWLSRMPDGCADLCVTDVPYESLEKHRAVGTTTRLTKQWFPIFPNSKFPELFAQVHRVLKPNSHFYFFCDAETMFVAKPLAEAAGFRFWKPLVFDKVSMGMGYHYRCQYEFILFFEKGKRKLNDLGVTDIIRVPRVRGGYPTEKPVEVSETLIRQSTVEGERVIDPFCGSGSVGVAATNLGRRFAGADISQAAVDLAQRRMGDGRISA